MKTTTYQEHWKYEWVPSKNRTIVEMDAYDKLSDLLPADWYPKNKLVYIIEDKKIYRAKHTRILEYVGLT